MIGSVVHLFSERSMRDFVQRREQDMLRELWAIEGNRLLNTSVDDLCNYLQSKYQIDVPEIQDDKTTIGHEEADIDVRRDFRYAVRDQSRPHYVKGTVVTLYVPFTGNAELFKCRGDIIDTCPPCVAVIKNGELIIEHKVIEHATDDIKKDFHRTLAEIKRGLDNLRGSASQFNDTLLKKVRNLIESRRTKLLKDQGLVADLGFPLRERPDAPKTYVTSKVRRKISLSPPAASTDPYVAEPTLDMKEYEKILSIISNMVQVMERSPHTFKDMKEEALRTHFLVQLNSQYEGQATGETFNGKGKTDILVHDKGKNVFIAECKFWSGPKSLRKTIDQLLGYTVWRDTKTAILVFNRNRDFSTVLSKIPEVVQEHPNCKRQVEYKSETGFRFVLHHPDDQNRELTLTVLAFEVPS